jgi:hypothetical protein
MQFQSEPAQQAAAQSSSEPDGTPRVGQRKATSKALDRYRNGNSMSDTTASLQRKINSAGDLQSVVRTMKALAANNIGQYEESRTGVG